MTEQGGETKSGDWRRYLIPRIRDEVDFIVAEFARHGIRIDGVSAGNGGIDYMFAADWILVRAEYLDRVVHILQESKKDGTKENGAAGKIEPEPVIEGVVLLHIREFGLSVPEALDRIDEILGEGKATPDHVLTVATHGGGTGGEVGVCPATEPQEVYERCGPFPFPPVCGDNDGSGVVIYLGDTGLLEGADMAHGWLSGVQRAPKAAVGGALQDWDTPPAMANGTLTIPSPYTGHGTFVAGVARCMAPDVTIYVADIFKIAGSALESHMARKLTEALGLDVDIFHLTIAATTRKDIHLIAFEAWLGRLHQSKGVVCVAAAGNNSSKRRCWPAAFPEVISVGALATDWRSRAGFSNFGRWVDVYAPGTNLINAYTEGVYHCTVSPYQGTDRTFDGLAQWSGTSFSTPIVTGLIAARMSWTGESASEAVASLLGVARAQAVPHTGPILLPCCGAAPRSECCCDAHCHGCGERHGPGR